MQKRRMPTDHLSSEHDAQLSENRIFLDGDRARKRLRLSTEEQSESPQTAQQKISRRLTSEVTGSATSDLLGLSKLATYVTCLLTRSEAEEVPLALNSANIVRSNNVQRSHSSV